MADDTHTHRRSSAAAVLAFGGSLVAQIGGSGDRLRLRRRSAEDAGRHLRRRSRRRRRQFEGPDLRLHAHRPSVRDARRQPHVLARRLAAVPVRSRPASSCASSGQDVYGFNAAIGLRVDPQDNVWTIDAAANQVVKFDAEGSVALVLGRKPEAIGVRPGRLRRRRRRRRRPVRRAARRRRLAARRGAGGGGAGGGGQAAAGPPGSGTPGSTLQPPDRRRVGQGRQHLRRRRHRQQQPHRQVRQGRPLHQAVGLDRRRTRASSTA